MAQSNTSSKNLARTLTIENMSESLFIHKAKLWFKIIRISTIVLLLLLVFAAIFMPDIFLFVTIPLTIFALLSAVIWMFNYLLLQMVSADKVSNNILA